MKPGEWSIPEIALGGALVGIAYGLWKEGGGLLLEGRYAAAAFSLLGSAIGVAFLAAVVAAIRNGFARYFAK